MQAERKWAPVITEMLILGEAAIVRPWMEITAREVGRREVRWMMPGLSTLLLTLPPLRMKHWLPHCLLEEVPA